MDEQERLRADIRRYKALSMMTSDRAATRVLNELIDEADAQLWQLEQKRGRQIASSPNRPEAARRATR